MIRGTAGQVAVQFSAKCTALGAGVTAMVPRATATAAGMVQRSVAGFLGGQTIVLRGVGPFGGRVGVRVRAGAHAPGGGDAALVSMTGPAQLVERDVQPHPVGTGATGHDHGQVMPMPDGSAATGPFVAGGSTGRHPFSRGVDAAAPLVPEVYRRALQGEMIRVFRG